MGALRPGKNLFNTWYNAILTPLVLLGSGWLIGKFLTWAFGEARWSVISDNLGLFLLGRYPLESRWRIYSILAIIAVNILVYTVLFKKKPAAKIDPRLGLLPVSYLISLWLLVGGGILKRVPIDDLGGLLLTLSVASVSIVLSFPFGILLALGRQSELPAIRWLSTGYIEIVRGLPLLGILFMTQVMLPLILPAGIRVDRVTRAIVGFTLFAAAYLAENVRGGLQSIPKGQVEAARALGLNPVLIALLIVLPQALKAVIPSLVGQFISLFKDTSLLAIVGLVELLGIAGSVLANPEYIGRYAEVYLFLAFIYGLLCYLMSWASRKLES